MRKEHQLGTILLMKRAFGASQKPSLFCNLQPSCILMIPSFFQVTGDKQLSHTVMDEAFLWPLQAIAGTKRRIMSNT
jgi:hypothetical protein